MDKPFASAEASQAPPPFWKQLPQVFSYPANSDTLVKIAVFAVGSALAEFFLPLGSLLSILIVLAFLAYCFGILERTARGHLTAAQFDMNERTSRDYRPLLQIVIVAVFLVFVALVSVKMGALAGQVAFVLVSLALPASIMVLALEERLVPAINPFRLISTIAGIGLPYLALCAFLFLLLQSSQYLAGLLAKVLPLWLGGLVAKVVSMYFTVSMYYLMGYVLYQNHAALGVDVQVDPAAAQQVLAKGSKAAPDVLGPMTQSLVAEGKLDEAAARVESRLRTQWGDDKLHERYHKLLLLDGKTQPIARHVNEFVPKLVREKRLARALEIYETARKQVPDLLIEDPTLILPLATQAYELKRDATALELVRAFDKRFPKSGDIPGVYLLAARILIERRNDYATAQAILRHLGNKYPQHPLAPEARRLGEVAAKLAAAPRPA